MSKKDLLKMDAKYIYNILGNETITEKDIEKAINFTEDLLNKLREYKEENSTLHLKIQNFFNRYFNNSTGIIKAINGFYFLDQYAKHRFGTSLKNEKDDWSDIDIIIDGLVESIRKNYLEKEIIEFLENLGC